MCPHCGEMLVGVNPRNNLGHRFGDARNMNNINLLMSLGDDFPGAIRFLEDLLKRFEGPDRHR